VLERVRRPVSPEGPGAWTLKLIHQHCTEFADLKSLSGVWRRLRRLDISWKEGRIHLTSPDPEFKEKLAAIRAVRDAAAQAPEQIRVLYGDEASYYRLPHRGRTWGTRGSGGGAQPTTPHKAGANTRRRMVAALDVHDGQVLSDSASVIGVKALCRFLRKIRRHYGAQVRLVLIWDNWPPHYHAEVLRVAAAERIELLYTPTYSPWCNPIEKLWKKLRHDVLRLHQKSAAWKELRGAVERFLQDLVRANPDLLRYVGLAA